MTQVAEKASLGVRIPPLQNGDHLTREEFERRFDATPGLKRAELIEGRVYILSPPTSILGHSRPHGFLNGLLFAYWAETPGVLPGDAGSIRLDTKNMPQPDLFMMIEEKSGGQSKIGKDDYLTGAPEFVAEISATTASYDLHEKMRLYERSGVREYLIWRSVDSQIDYYILREGQYQRLPSIDGVYRSEAFPGLRIDAGALVDSNPAKALSELRKGLASPEHAAFVEALKSKAPR